MIKLKWIPLLLAGAALLTSAQVQKPAAPPPPFILDHTAVEQFNETFTAGDFAGAADILNTQKPALIAALARPGDAAEWMAKLVRAEYHSGDFASMRSAVNALKKSGSPLAGEAAVYELLAQMDEGKAAVVTAALPNVTLSDCAAAEMVYARAAVESGDHKTALRHLARLGAFHYRETDWLPPALYHESLIYRQTGAAKAEQFTVRELKASDPSGRWHQKAVEELKKFEQQEG
ncbi:MAG: hypothetical protein WC959_10880 [Kiritimatiellales bacterium]